MREDGPAKLDVQIKSDWLLICFAFVAKSLDVKLTPRRARIFEDVSIKA